MYVHTYTHYLLYSTSLYDIQFRYFYIIYLLFGSVPIQHVSQRDSIVVLYIVFNLAILHIL